MNCYYHCVKLFIQRSSTILKNWKNCENILVASSTMRSINKEKGRMNAVAVISLHMEQQSNWHHV